MSCSIAFGGARRTRTSGDFRFSALAMSFRQLFSHFPDISDHFGGLAFGVFQKAPKKAPKTVRLYANYVGRPRVRGRRSAAFLLVFPGLLAFLQVSRTSADVTGSLRKWDGWPPNSPSKYLISQIVFSLQFPQMPPQMPPRGVGCHWTSLDIKYDPVNDRCPLNIALVISGCPWIPANCFRCLRAP